VVKPDEDDTERLRKIQADRAREEEQRAEQSPEEDEQRVHERRSAKADYLREKLDEQRRSS
jgi:hypothetical protein